MAKITIELDTIENADDIKVLRAVALAYGDFDTDAAVELNRAEAEDEPTRPIEAAPSDAAPKATRAPRKPREAAAPTAEPTPAPATNQPDASTTGTSGTGSTDPGVTLADVNNKLKECLGAHPAAKIQEVVRQATDSKYGSATGMFNDAALSDAEKAKFLADIMAGLNAL